MAMYKKKFPNDPNAINLANWEKFEMKNPDTFRDMFCFLVQESGRLAFVFLCLLLLQALPPRKDSIHTKQA